jgi:hypothetical protein
MTNCRHIKQIDDSLEQRIKVNIGYYEVTN